MRFSKISSVGTLYKSEAEINPRERFSVQCGETVTSKLPIAFKFVRVSACLLFATSIKRSPERNFLIDVTSPTKPVIPFSIRKGDTASNVPSFLLIIKNF